MRIIQIPTELNFLKSYTIYDYPYQVKLGGYKDGGYVTDFRLVLQTQLLLSGGVGSNVRFESDFFEINNDIKVIMVDPTVSIFRMFLRAFYHFFKINQSGFKSLSEVFNFLYFKNKSELIRKYLDNTFTISQILENYNCDKSSVFIKLDIEGFEYELLSSMLDQKEYFTGICIEFHSLEKVSNQHKLEKFLRDLDFNIINISVNETCLLENDFPSILEISLVPKGLNQHFVDFNSSYYLQSSNGFNGKTIVLSK